MERAATQARGPPTRLRMGSRICRSPIPAGVRQTGTRVFRLCEHCCFGTNWGVAVSKHRVIRKALWTSVLQMSDMSSPFSIWEAGSSSSNRVAESGTSASMLAIANDGRVCSPLVIKRSAVIVGGLSIEYRVKLERTDEGYAVWCPGLPGCWSQGATEKEALESITDAIETYLATVEELVKDKVSRLVEVPA